MTRIVEYIDRMSRSIGRLALPALKFALDLALSSPKSLHGGHLPLKTLRSYPTTIRSLWLSSSLAFRNSTSQASPVVRREGQSILARLLGSRLSAAAGLQVSSWWGKHKVKVYGLVGLVATYLIWKGTFRLASVFVNLTETMAEWGLLGLAATVVAMIGLYLRSYYSINPLSVYRAAMNTLHTNPAVLEILGAPLSGSEVRVMVLSGGGVSVSRALKPKIRSPRIQMMFRVSGIDRHGLVSLEAKKKKGKHVFKLLTVDVQPAASIGAKPALVSERDGAARVYIYGDRDQYNRGGLLWELRQPYLNALSLQSSFELEDEVDDEVDSIKVPVSQPVAEPREEPKANNDDAESFSSETLVIEKKSTWTKFLFRSN